ncbi:MAG: dTDP-4-dehydrorhamnose 3,5-epimerase family protein [Elusimicrobia bacterium]|nr:dTDP-4-dehydrorhamnose 3,5-epimerase family protein [Elusimicrobiota bacterium]
MIAGVSVRPLKRLRDARGEVRHMLKRADPEFSRFGEVYFSSVNPGFVKGWHIHKKMTLNYAAVSGRAKLVLYDERRDSKTFGKVQEIELSLRKYCLVTIPPGVWNGFKCLGSQPALIANCASHPHETGEIARLNPFANHIPYNWGIAKGGG